MDKLAFLKTLIAPDTADDDLLEAQIAIAEGIVLNRRYPYGYPEGTVVPERFEVVQCQIAAELFAKRGAEGEMSHSENGVVRSYEAGTVSLSLLRKITPLIGSVNSNA